MRQLHQGNPDDYSSFRSAVSAYEEPIRRRIEKWTAEHPEILAQIGGPQPAAEVLEEVFVHAFENHYVRGGDFNPESSLDRSFDSVTQALVHRVGTGKREVGSARTDTPQRS